MKALVNPAALMAVASLAVAGASVAQTSDPAAEAPAATVDTSAPAADAGVAPPADAAADPPVDTVPVAQAAAPEPPAAEAPTPAPKEEGGFGEIIVTAQRREERLQDVPISMTVFTPEQLSNANIQSGTDLATYTPSLTANTRFGSDNAAFAIRGFVQDLRTTASVGTYFAEVIAPRGQSSQTSGDGAGPGALFDLQNVQVLKGPQGTLFGRNTTGGAVLIVPKKPTDEFEGYIEASGGDYEQRRVQSVVNVPVVPSFKLRFGVDYSHRQGHLTNVTGIGATHFSGTDYTALRMSAVWNITDTLENYTILTGTNSDNNGSTAALFSCHNPADVVANPLVILNQDQCRQQLDRQRAAGQDGFYDLVSTIATPMTKIKERRVINTTTWELSDQLTFKNIAAFSHLNTQNGSDIFGTQFKLVGITLGPLVIAGDPDPNREFKSGISVKNPDEPVTSQDTYVEELQFQGKSAEGQFIWQTGAYYETSRPDGFSGNNSAAFVSCNLKTIEGDPSGFDCFDPLGGFLGGVLVQQYKNKYENQALYFQSTYSPFDQLSFTTGIRYTWDETKSHGIKTRYTWAGPVPLPTRTTVADPKQKSDAPTGMVEMDFKPTDDVMAYMKFVRGYRQGSTVLAADATIDTFKEEKVNTYEIGMKNTFTGIVPGRFNFALFYNDFRNQQLQYGYVSPSSGTTTAIVNAGRSRIKGAEVEAYFRLLPGLVANLSASYLDTKLLSQKDFSSQVTAAGAIPGTATPIADVGDELPFAPDRTFVTGLTYTLPLPPEWGTIDLAATWVYIGKQRVGASSVTPYSEIQPYELLNANVNWTGVFNLPVDFSVFCTNALDKEYATYLSATDRVLGFDSRSVGLPRFIGARLKYNFGS